MEALAFLLPNGEVAEVLATVDDEGRVFHLPGEHDQKKHGRKKGKTFPPVTVYHGTLDRVLDKIKKEGVQPQKGDARVWNEGFGFYKGDRAQAVFVTTDRGVAQSWADDALTFAGYQADNAAFVEIEVPHEEWKKFKQDREANLGGPVNFYRPGGIPPEWIKSAWKRLAGTQDIQRVFDDEGPVTVWAVVLVDGQDGEHDYEIVEKPLYVRRDVLNADAIIAWAKDNGFETCLPAEDMHVTVCYSKRPLNWQAVAESTDTLKIEGGQRLLARLGEDGDAVVLRFDSAALQRRHSEFEEAGASWDWDEYLPHITLSYDFDGLTDIQAYPDVIILGPERFEEIVEDWHDEIKENAEQDGSRYVWQKGDIEVEPVDEEEERDKLYHAAYDAYENLDYLAQSDWQEVYMISSEAKYLEGPSRNAFADCLATYAASDYQAGKLPFIIEQYFAHQCVFHLPGGHDQKKHGRHGVPAPALELLQSLKRHGGFTYNAATRKSPQSGLMLSLYPDRSVVIDRDDLNAKVIKDYVAQNGDLLKTHEHYLGGWRDRKSGKIFLDISTRVSSHDEAKELSEKHKQRAYWSLDDGKEYRVVDEKRAHDQYVPPVYVAIPVQDMTDADVEAFIRALTSGEYDDTEGVWRTINGRHVFLGKGEDATTAILRSRLEQARMGPAEEASKVLNETLKAPETSETEFRSLERYIGGEAYQVNNFLRGQRPVLDAHRKEIIPHIDALFNKAEPLPFDMEVTRGIGFEAFRSLQLKEGDVFTDKSFVSTTLTKDPPENITSWGNTAIFDIKVPKGSKALSIPSFQKMKYPASEFQELEAEVLLPRDSSFRVTKIKGNQIQAELLPRVTTHSYAQRDYSGIIKTLDALEGDARERLIRVLGDSRDRSIDALEKAADLNTLARDFKLPLVSFIRETLGRMLNDAFSAGSKDALSEVVEVKEHAMTAGAAQRWMLTKTFWVTDVLSDELTQTIRRILVNSIKTGEPQSETARKIRKAFVPFVGDPDALEGGVPLTAARVDTIIRTNVTDAYNQGRMKEFMSKDMRPFLQGVRYSAIMDDRTTPVCRHLHEKIFPVDSPDLDAFMPPNHFNCRSVVVPVVVGEKVRKKDFITKAQITKARTLADAKFLSAKDYERVMSFFSLMDGEAHSFRFKDWEDYAWNPSDHPRGKTTAKSRGGSFAPKAGGVDDSADMYDVSPHEAAQTLKDFQAKHPWIRMETPGFVHPRMMHGTLKELEELIKEYPTAGQFLKKVRFANLPHMGESYALTEYDLAVPELGATVSFNSKWYEYPSKYKAALIESASDKSAQQWPYLKFHDGITDLESTTRHEFGHVIEATLLADDGKRKKYANFIETTFGNSIGKIVEHSVTGYSLSNSQEWFAETFAATKYGDATAKSKPIVQRFLGLLKEWGAK